MTIRAVTGVLATALVLAAPMAQAGSRASAPAPVAAPAPPRVRAATPVAPDERVVRLGRAVLLSRAHDPRGVIEQLESVDFSSPAFAGADRGAFLLAQAYLELGDHARFAALADTVARWREAGAATRWLALERALDRAEPGLPVDGAPSLLPAREAADAATLREAVRNIAGGAGGESLLTSVPTASRFSARARHLAGLLALERGDRARGTALLESVLDRDSTYEARREVGLALAGDAMEQGHWDDAYARYQAVDRDWAGQRDALERVRTAGAWDDVWTAWASRPDSSGALVVDAAPVRGRAFALAAAGAASLPEPPAVLAAPALATHVPAVLRPAPERWEAVAASAQAVDMARAALDRARADVAREAWSLGDRRRYLALGLDSLRRSDARMAPIQATLDSLRGRIDATDRTIRTVRDGEAARVASRTAAIRDACARQAAWAQGLRRLYVTGPDSAQYVRSPQGYPTAAAALAAELRLNASLQALASHLASAVPGWLARSYEQAWAPKLLDHASAEADSIGAERRDALALAGTLDSCLAAARTSEALERARTQVAARARAADSAASADGALRAQVAREAVNATLAAIQREREGIDYGLSAALYARAVKLGASDSAQAPVAVAAGTAAPGTAAPDGAADDQAGQEPPAVASARAEALPVLRAFLVQHPASPVRGEMRFRLADLELAQARQEFRERMAAYVKHPGAGQVVPVMDPARALALYRAILAEDRDFPHLDAVRFNAGMILADAGEPEAGTLFAELVATTPDSPYAQESWLRMGDMAFDDRRFEEAATRYAHASAPGDPTLAVMARYKLGWAHFNQDHFADAADAFRTVLDLYGERRADVHVDIESEADAYLVHSLAGAGGAPAFARCFDACGPRPYAPRVLMALGQQFRRFGEFPDAAAADQMMLDRYGELPDALLAAERLVDTWQRAEHPDREREAREALAPRFAPGGAWYAAQHGDSLRDAGEAFARTSLLAVAQAHHAAARASGSADEWRSAVTSYANVLERWPHDAQAGEIRMAAGEASAHAGDYAGALRWYEGAAHDGRDSLVTAARVQRVAAADAWYERSRAGAATGSDSLAHLVLETGDDLLKHAPQHARAADVTWRQSQLALAHGWNDRASGDLARMAHDHAADPRAPLAAVERGELLFRTDRYDDAGEAFAAALDAAKAQGRDSLVRIATAALPVCAYRGAEAAVAADSGAYGKHAERFEQVSVRWPQYALAPLALYRAGLAWGRAGKPRDEVRTMQSLLAAYPRCEYAGDARLQVAHTLEGMNEKEPAALAYLEFSHHETDRENAAAAWLKAAELFEAAGRVQRADSLRLAYIAAYPADVEGAMSIREALARRELAAVDADHPVSRLLAAPAPVRSRRHAPAPSPSSQLAAYLALAAKHPALASRELIAHVRFLEGEESRSAFDAVRLTQPLARSAPVKKALLDTVLVRYRRTADVGVPAWAHASALRIGQALQGFAEALNTSEPPADLHGDDLRAYRNVLAEKAAVFSSRGDDVWSALLRQQPADSTGDAWVSQAREALYGHLAHRFLFRPEVEFPLVDAHGPARTPAEASAAAPADSTAPVTRTARNVARREGASR